MAFALGVLSTAQLLVATTVAGIAFVGFDSAQFGALPAPFGRARLITAMTALGSVDTALYIVGSAMGGVLATTIGAAPAVGLDPGSFVVSGALLAGVRGSFGERRAQGVGGWRRWRGDIAEGVGFLWQHRLIRALTLAGSAAALTGGAVTGLLVVFAIRELGMGVHDARIRLLFSAGAVGALAGTVLVPRLTRHYDIPRLNLVARTASLMLVMGFAVLHTVGLALACTWLSNAAESLAIRSAIAFRQLNTPDHLQGRVNVVGRMTALAGQPIGAGLGGVIAQLINVRGALLAMSLGLGRATVRSTSAQEGRERRRAASCLRGGRPGLTAYRSWTPCRRSGVVAAHDGATDTECRCADGVVFGQDHRSRPRADRIHAHDSGCPAHRSA